MELQPHLNKHGIEHTLDWTANSLVQVRTLCFLVCTGMNIGRFVVTGCMRLRTTVYKAGPTLATAPRATACNVRTYYNSQSHTS